MDRPPVDPAAALAEHAARRPEDPFLFIRDPRGRFAWWSWARAQAAAGAAHDADAADAAAGAARGFLEATLALGGNDRTRAAALLAALPAAASRDIWLTRGDLATSTGRALALAALDGGWAVVHDPAPELHPETFLWARPTIVGGELRELDALLAGCERLAPRWRAGRWLARRVGRLRAVVIGEADPGALASRLRRLGSPARVLSIPPVRW